MLSTLNPKHADLRDGTDPYADETHLVARVEEELSKLAHEAAGHAAPAPSAPLPRVDTPTPSERPAPPIEITPRLAANAAELASPTADLRNDPHDFVPISPTLDESRPAQHDAAPPFNPPPRVAPVFSATRPARPVPPIEATFRPAARADEAVNDPFLKGPLASLSQGPAPGPREIPGQARETQPPRRSWLRRAVTSFILALVGVGATYAWQHHGDEARAISGQMLAKWAPQVSLPSWLKFPGQSSDQDPAVAAQASEPPVQAAVAAAAPAPSQPAATPSMTLAAAPPAQAAPQDATPATATPAVAALPPEATQQLQAMARELASLRQTIDQLKAGQDQMARDIAKLSDQDARRRVATPAPPSPPRPIPAPAAARTRPVAAMPPPPPITARRPYPTPPPSATPQATSPQAITPQNLSPQAAAPRVLPPSPQSYDPDAATAPRPPRPLQPQSSEP